MNFTQFISQGTITEAASEKYKYITKDAVYVGNNHTLKDVYVLDESIELESSDNVLFSLCVVLDKDEEKRMDEVCQIEVNAKYNIDASYDKGDYETPESLEFDIDKSSIKATYSLYIDKSADEKVYPGFERVSEATKELYKDKDKLDKIVKVAVTEIFEKYNDQLFKKFKKEKQD